MDYGLKNVVQKIHPKETGTSFSSPQRYCELWRCLWLYWGGEGTSLSPTNLADPRIFFQIWGAAQHETCTWWKCRCKAVSREDRWAVLIYHHLECCEWKGSGRAVSPKERRRNYKRNLHGWVCLSKEGTWRKLLRVLKNIHRSKASTEPFPSLCGPSACKVHDSVVFFPVVSWFQWSLYKRSAVLSTLWEYT